MGLTPLSLYGAGSPFYFARLGPLSIKGAGSPFKQWGCVPFYCVGLNPLAIDWREDILQIPSSLEHPSASYNAKHVWFCSTVDPNLRGWVPFYYVELDPPFIMRGWVPFQSPGLGPLSINRAGSPSALWGWVPFYSMGPGPLSICGAAPPFIQWGWVPFYSVGLGPLSFCGTEYHRWWCHGVAMLCHAHLCAGAGICHPSCPAV